ncbi:MAG: histidinol phosphate phosphatase domain-containing protein [candidate division FCPU426 bacterium]
MIDLHMHTLHSDGDLLPAELIRRAKVKGYRALALTDHADQSNLMELVPATVAAARSLSVGAGLVVLAGIELTHVPPRQIPALIRTARELGADLVVVHGETPVEPVAPGTNRAAILGGADVLAHPGFISAVEARLARQRGVALELTSRAGHSLTNGHVALTAGRARCPLVVNSDAHTPRDLHVPETIAAVVKGAGLPATSIRRLQEHAWTLCRRMLERRRRLS